MFNANAKVIDISQLARLDFRGSSWVMRCFLSSPPSSSDAAVRACAPAAHLGHMLVLRNAPFVASLDIVPGLERKASRKTSACANCDLKPLEAEIRLVF